MLVEDNIMIISCFFLYARNIALSLQGGYLFPLGNKGENMV